MTDPLVVDGHNDLPWAMRKVGYDFAAVDIAHRPAPAAHRSAPAAGRRVGAQFWSVFVPCSFTGAAAVTATLEQIDAVYDMIERYPDDLALVTHADGLDLVLADGQADRQPARGRGRPQHRQLARACCATCSGSVCAI